MAASDSWHKATECSTCEKKFTLTVRRHHCRKCCKSFCANHLAVRRPDLPEEKGSKVCVPCLLTMPPPPIPGVERSESPMRILAPIPTNDFDPTELAVPWRYLDRAGHVITFATPNGEVGAADPKVVTGQGLGIFAKVLSADYNGRVAYEELSNHKAFNNPITYDDIVTSDYDALLLVGGHAPGMKEYLESGVLQTVVAEFFLRRAPVAAIDRGTLLCGRTTNPNTGRSVLFGKRTTGLTKTQEMASFNMTRAFLKDCYRTYETPCELELKAFLEREEDFTPGPTPLYRDSPTNVGSGFTVRDDTFLSARSASDAHRFAIDFLTILDEYDNQRLK